MTDKPLPVVAILGASGLIGQAVAFGLRQNRFTVVPIARRFNPPQKYLHGKTAVERPIVALEAATLTQIFVENRIDIVVNCVGVLQDGYRGSTDAVHRAFVERLVTILGSYGRPALLIHLSIPGNGRDDRTSFSRTKRAAERAVLAGSVPFMILRPGFVVAPAAYGGSALLRALATLPLDLPAFEAGRPFMTTDVADIVRTIAIVGHKWANGERSWNVVWDVMASHTTTVADVLYALRRHLGGPSKAIALPSRFMELGARLGDIAAYLGWSPPIRSTALQEIRRGVSGNPESWVAGTGIEPTSLESALQRQPPTVQDKWFARLYLTKSLVLASLASFWVFSGLIALTAAFPAAAAVLTSYGFSPSLARTATIASSLADISVGLAISIRKSCRIGLVAGIGLSLFYMAGATILAPDLWIEPLGALVKTGPAIVLMLVALAILEDR
jgi:nucleoside-diphosphate-sugar epimerase